ncbi:MAG: hypothetical protein IKE43_00650 [Coriobacteriales bacterium]|nr:hypothetical protein [Coriobacteriales bacterium]
MSTRGLIFYLVLEALLLCLIETGIYMSWNGQIVNTLMYAAILINTIVVAYRFFRLRADQRSAHDKFIAYAIFVTAVADIFLTLIGSADTFLPGVILFCMVQIIYAIYLYPTAKSLLIRVALFAICLLLLKIFEMLSLSNAFGLLDISLLLVNVIIAWTLTRVKIPLLFRIGITLFLCCDLSIALRIFTTGEAFGIIGLLVWLFYIPSQVLITLSYLSSTSVSRSVSENRPLTH